MIAASASVAIGHAAMDAAIANYPEQRFTLRNGDTVYSAASEELVPPSVRQATSQFPHCVRTHLLVYYEESPVAAWQLGA